MTDTTVLIHQGHHDLNKARCRAVKNDLNKAGLCCIHMQFYSSPLDHTGEYLFGDLSKLAKDLTDANRLFNKVCPSAQQASSSSLRERRSSLAGRKNITATTYALSSILQTECL